MPDLEYDLTALIVAAISLALVCLELGFQAGRRAATRGDTRREWGEG